MPLSLDALRVGHIYRMHNFGEDREFVVVKRTTDIDYAIKDRLTQEPMQLSELLAYGRSKDFELDEINESGQII